MPTDEKRIKAMRELYDSGSTLQEVGAAFGISGKRVQQLFQAHGVERRKRGTQPVMNAQRRRAIVQQYLDGWARIRLAEVYGVSVGMIDGIIQEELPAEVIAERHRRQAAKRPAPMRDWTDGELIRAIQECAKDLETDKFGIQRYSAWRADKEGEWPSAQLYYSRRPIASRSAETGASWNEWRELAGLPTRVKPAGMGQVRFGYDEIYRALLRVEGTLGHFPSLREYEATHDRGREPTAGAIRRRHSGKWGVVRQKFAEWKGSTNGESYEASMRSSSYHG